MAAMKSEPRIECLRPFEDAAASPDDPEYHSGRKRSAVTESLVK
jgi:hypothetical protein